jgi:cellulose synthase/poly-beta-1,6-N-acetylglucosamine synthase-like glycosyltransferase
MSGVLGIGPVSFASSSVWPSLTGWLTLGLAITWTVTGLLLLLFGWVVLPRAPERTRADAPEVRASPGLRVLGGAVLAVGAVVIGAVFLDHDASWAAVVLGGMGALGLLAYTLAAGIPFTTMALDLSIAGAEIEAFGRWLGAGLFGVVEWIGRALTVGVTWIVHAAPGLATLAVMGATAVWQDRGYAVINLTALVLTIAVGGFAGWMSSSSRWRASGVVTFLGIDFLAMGLIGFSLLIVEHAPGPLGRGLGFWLLGVEMLGMFLFVAYQFYTMEYLAGRERAGSADEFPVDPNWTPHVLVQVASYNEPPQIVENCLASVLNVDYPKGSYLVQLVDDSTDARTVDRLRTFCSVRGIHFQHRTDRRGFKGGALNDGLRAIGRPVDLVAIVDSDYVVEPQFLRVGVQPFRERAIGFVQTPQAYRNAGPGTFARWYALADAYFYRVIQPVRARARSMIFCGTMGLVRRTALESAGGWSETCVTEDAELSLRLLAGGWRGHYVPKIVGWGLAPDLMSAVRSQHRRWAFGGLQMLRMNREKLTSAHLSLRQRVDFRMGGLFWVDGLFLIGVTTALASLVVASWFGVTLPIGSTAALAVIASAPLLLMVDGLVKIRLALRATTPVSLGDALGIIAFWYAIKLNDLRGAMRGWWGSKLTFVRTPKDTRAGVGRASALGGALRGSAAEATVAVALVAILGITADRWGVFRGHAISLGAVTLLVWLGYYAFAFASAPAFDYASRRSSPGPGEVAPTSPVPTPPASTTPLQ